MKRRLALAALLAAGASAFAPFRKAKRSLAEFEKPRDPQAEAMGSLGRGVEIPDIDDFDTSGYRAWTSPGSDQTRFPLYGHNGLPSDTVWMSFIPLDRPHMRLNVEVMATSQERRLARLLPRRGPAGNILASA